MTQSCIRNNNCPPFLEWENISVAREGQIVLHSITLTIRSGEHVAILGPNGSGKSSLIKLMTRDLYPIMSDSPYIYKIWGKDQWNVFDLRSKLGIVTNDLLAMFSKEISGEEVLLSGFFSSIGLFHHPVTDEMRWKSREIAEFLGIMHLMDRSVIRMSSGEVRRFLIGRALVHSPEVLILDEPASNLDLTALHCLREYIRRIASKGIAIILVTHQIFEIIPEINRIILMKDGKIAFDGGKKDACTEKLMSSIFSVPVQIHQKDGYYYSLG